eukprot:m.159796 g.159796  ORF g.159796 m.159796 type:complete len:50 (-) comp14342_c0_seq26:4158-4307(-)
MIVTIASQLFTTYSLSLFPAYNLCNEGGILHNVRSETSEHFKGLLQRFC